MIEYGKLRCIIFCISWQEERVQLLFESSLGISGSLALRCRLGSPVYLFVPNSGRDTTTVSLKKIIGISNRNGLPKCEQCYNAQSAEFRRQRHERLSDKSTGRGLRSNYTSKTEYYDAACMSPRCSPNHMWGNSPGGSTTAEYFARMRGNVDLDSWCKKGCIVHGTSTHLGISCMTHAGRRKQISSAYDWGSLCLASSKLFLVFPSACIFA